MKHKTKLNHLIDYIPDYLIKKRFIKFIESNNYYASIINKNETFDILSSKVIHLTYKNFTDGEFLNIRLFSNNSIYELHFTYFNEFNSHTVIFDNLTDEERIIKNIIE